MLNNQIHRDKRLDNLKGIDSEKESARATEIKERKELFLLQHIILSIGTLMITYFLVIGILENSENLKGFNGYFFILLTIFLAYSTIYEFFYATKKLIFFLAEYVSLLKVIIHTAAISASATALSFFFRSELAMNHIKSLKSQLTIIDQYYLYPFLIYYAFFGAIILYRLHNLIARR